MSNHEVIAIDHDHVCPKLAPAARLRFDPIDQRHLLLSPERGLLLNHTATAILELCDGTRTVAEIAAALRERYPRADESQVAAFLARLRERGLVVAG
jgi:pyrroloquinoline quinone biosynthesis protein D